ncbi:MAG TPA: hypothetical protein VJL84_02095, partial [Kiloniellales bacterium]|nr:hypothetical protein [Kiloniellales bacterium]
VPLACCVLLILLGSLLVWNLIARAYVGGRDVAPRKLVGAQGLLGVITIIVAVFVIFEGLGTAI